MDGRWLWLPALWLAAISAWAVIPEIEGTQTDDAWVARLADPERSRAALDELVGRRDRARLSAIARADVDVAARGWAVVGLSRLGDPESDAVLRGIHDATEPPVLVRTWAAAARIGSSADLAGLRQLMPLRNTLPGLERPLRMRVERLVADASLEDLVGLSADPQLAAVVVPVVLDRGADATLVALIYRHPEDAVRRQAAALAATLATRDPTDRAVAGWVLEALALPRGGGATTPWQGGALYVPGLTWSQSDARILVHTLISWWLVLDAREASAEKQQVWNNLYSVGLLATAGYDRSIRPDPASLVNAVAAAEGVGAARELLRQVGRTADPRLEGIVQ